MRIAVLRLFAGGDRAGVHELRPGVGRCAPPYLLRGEGQRQPRDSAGAGAARRRIRRGVGGRTRAGAARRWRSRAGDLFWRRQDGGRTQPRAGGGHRLHQRRKPGGAGHAGSGCRGGRESRAGRNTGESGRRRAHPPLYLDGAQGEQVRCRGRSGDNAGGAGARLPASRSARHWLPHRLSDHGPRALAGSVRQRAGAGGAHRAGRAAA